MREVSMLGSSAVNGFPQSTGPASGSLPVRRAGSPASAPPAPAAGRVVPPARYAQAMIYDGRRAVMFGSSPTSHFDGNRLNDTWTFSEGTWNQLRPATSPPPRDCAAIAFDGTRVVLFGGSGTGNANLNDTWVFDGTTWTQIQTSTSPAPRYNASMAFDGRHVVLFGGSISGNQICADTCIFDGTGPDTTEAFVYRTPRVDALDVVTPLNSWTAPFDIAGGVTTIEAALTTTFATLFGSASGLPITVAVLYGYEIVPAVDGAGGLTAYLPVGLYPGQQLGAGTAGEIASALASWQAANQPATAGGEWVLSRTLYSQINPSAQRPLLTLERLVYRLSPTR